MRSTDPPPTERVEVRDILHGVEIVDPYRWLEDTHSAQVGSWLETQNRYARSFLDGCPDRAMLRPAFERLFRTDSLAYLNPNKGMYYLVQRRAQEDLWVLSVQAGLHGTPRVLVDPNRLSKERGSPVTLSGYSQSRDNTLLMYGLSESANDQRSIHVLRVTTGEPLEDRIPAELYPYNGCWAPDNSGFWYTRRPARVPPGEEKLHLKVFYHRLGSPHTEDLLVFGGECAKEDIPAAALSEDGRFLCVTVHLFSEAQRRTEIFVQDRERPDKGFIPVLKGMKAEGHDSCFYGQIHRDQLYITHNFGAPNWRLDRVALAEMDQGMRAWRTLIPEHGDRVIESVTPVGDRLFVCTRENVHSTLRDYTLEGAFIRDIALPTLGTCGPVWAEQEGAEAFFEFSSFAYPDSLFRIDLESGRAELFKQRALPFDVGSIATVQVTYASKDGTQVPMFLVHRKDLAEGRPHPCVLYGYGGFNISQTPYFITSILPFIERGGIWALANLRGGGEFGEAWHEAGVKKNKQVVFDDFIAAAEWLQAQAYTDAGHLAISGGSNGGLLVGAAMTQRPELFKAVVMHVPVADMLRYHLFNGGRLWISEYGSAEDAELFPFLLKYSPYHNIKNGTAYPATLIITSDQDDRVHPGQAFKMAARLQEAGASGRPMLLRVEHKAGHGGAADITRVLDKAVDEWGFLFQALGVGDGIQGFAAGEGS
jgi:prolyl oligopeptidase